MPSKRKPKRAPYDPAQYERFLEAAKVAGADKKPEVCEQAFKKIVRGRGRLSK